MTVVFDEAHAAASKRAILGRAAFYWREFTGLIWTASCAQIRIHCGCTDRVNGFANGRAVIAALIFAFVAVVAAIEILKSFTFHGHRAELMLWHEFLLLVLAELTVVCGGVVGWTIAFLVAHTGMHRIANINTGSRQE